MGSLNSLEMEQLHKVSGGETVGVFPGGGCRKPKGFFIPIEGKKNQWSAQGRPEKCEYCWHLKFKDGFYCDA